MQQADIVIAGAGIVGLSIALRMRQCGRSVLVVEKTVPGAGASRAAAGMLAVHDRSNPAQLTEIAERSMALYPKFLGEIASLGGAPVPFETDWTLERSVDDSGAVPANILLPALSPAAGPFSLHREHSLDPRKLFASLLAAVEHSGLTFLYGEGVTSTRSLGEAVQVVFASSSKIVCNDFVDCTGAWSTQHASPVRGQMLRLQLPARALHVPGKGNIVVRTPEIYLVPRLNGTCVVGATIEDAGFDTVVRPETTAWLRSKAAELLPALATASEIESWCGLRPGTANSLPVLGRISPHRFVATGLYRNGILLAPVVAEILTALLQGKQPAVNISDFLPRFNHVTDTLGFAHPLQQPSAVLKET